MKRMRFSEEQITLALRQADSGRAIEETCRKMRISEPTFYRWKKVCAGMGVSEMAPEADRGRERETEASGVPHPRRSDVPGCLAKKMVRPAVRREIVHHLQKVYDVGERRACKATGFHRSTQHYKSRGDPQTEQRMLPRHAERGVNGKGCLK